MLEVVSWFIIAFVTHLLDCYIFCQIEKDVTFKMDGRTIIAIIIFALIDCIVDIHYGKMMRMVIANMNTVILLMILYQKSIVRIMIFLVFVVAISCISEMIAGVLLISGLGQTAKQLSSFPLNYVTNGMIFVLYYGLWRIKKVKKTVKSMMDWYKENEKINLILSSIIAILSVVSLVYPLSLTPLTRKETLIFILFLLSAVIFISGFFKQKTDNNELQTKYEAINDYSKAYEKMLALKSKKQHEYQNQLIMIREMSHKNNRKLRRYIDEVLNKEEKDKNYTYIKKLRNIPEGGLKGLIYAKMEKMLEEKIEVYVDVSDKLAKKRVWKNMDKDLRDISMSLGVYMDNAIEAAKEGKKKYITVEVEFEKGEIIFEIANTYRGEIKEIGKMGYTTKGMGRGQGLVLVKEIIEGNEKLREEREIRGSYYIQRLIYQSK